MRDETPDEIVFAIDLRRGALDEERDALEHERAPVPHPLPPVPVRPIRTVALIVDDADPILRPIEPTRDVRMLDALGRLLRYSALLGISVTEVAERYGAAYEREVLGRLPRWAFRGSRRASTSTPRPSRDSSRSRCRRSRSGTCT